MTARDRFLDKLIGATLLATIIFMEAGPAAPLIAAPAGLIAITAAGWCMYEGYKPERMRSDASHDNPTAP